MFEDSPRDGDSPTGSQTIDRDARAVWAFHVFFVLHGLGFLAVILQEGAAHPVHSLVRTFALWSGGDHAPGGSWQSAPWQLVTYAFLHQQPLEVGFSVAILLTLGAQLERTLGSARFVILYLATIAGTGLMAQGLDALCGEIRPVGSETLFLGALGGSAGLVAAYALAHPLRRTLGLMPAPAFFCATTFFVVLAIYHLQLEPTRKLVELLQSNLAPDAWLDKQLEQGAHPIVVLPQAFGLVVAPVAFALDQLAAHFIARARVRRGIRVLEEHLEARARVEQLLEKISREGLSALSWREKKYLQYASRFYPNAARVTSDGQPKS